ncbi:AraC family transcriptional regulator [Paenibacillus sp. PCH8]|uniref:AraC family transcriptional regulator n=1 Tax=Paenibacillus sp. PCH8 TaxID=2066524 RepID=UPI000CF961C0|nr:AraC family transcriptional regulator [Paenibacillus sp. PCH8]PQP83032.1 AraC family transcriptional regulator [Paenibacillus sp. PCH8]
MDIFNHMLLWNHAYCKIYDVRRVMLKSGQSERSYVVPASLLILSVRGSAQVMLNETAYSARRFHIFHTGKGSVLTMEAGPEGYEYYAVYYKATLSPGTSQELKEVEADLRPFDTSYSLLPSEPVMLYRLITDMYKEWKITDLLGPLRVKSLMFQLISELLNQMQTQGTRSHKRDLAAQIISIIQTRYADVITLESLSESLNYSVAHLSSYFKSRTGLSPIDYLIKVRIDKAAAMLLETDATLKEIAASVGYQDPYYLGRLFKKYKGVSPSHYRAQQARRPGLEDCPSTTMRLSIGPPKPLRYTDIDDNDYQSDRDGEDEINMYSGSKTSTAVVLLFSLMLLLSACGTGNVANNSSTTAENGAAPKSTKQEQAAGTSTSEQPQTKTVSTVTGDIEVPVQPKRIVAGEYLGSLIALGVTPVGTSSHHIINPYLNDVLKNVEDLGDGNGNLEKIAAMEPDLIIMDDTYAEMNEQLVKIAPTVIVPYASFKTVHEEITYFGELLGKEKEAEAWLTEYDRRTAAAKEKVLKVIPADSTFSILEYLGKDISTVGSNYGKGGQPIYNVLGFKPPAAVMAELQDPGWASLSTEVLPQYAGDYIVLTTDNQTMETLKADPIWGGLDAVKNDRVYIWGADRSWYWDPIAILTQTEELADWLVKTKQ